jgi:hypothetical protein
MKKLITLALIIGATIFTQAQSNLVFNQVLTFTLDVTNPQATVPEGKVWKVESIHGQNLFVSKTGNSYGSDMNNVDFGYFSSGQPAKWFPEGTILSNGPNVTPSRTVHLSLLEFNVVAISSSSGGSGGGVSADGLVFSGIINQFIPTSSVTGIGTVAGSFTVPEGKIWKINNITHKKIAGSGAIVSLNGTLNISMDGVPIYSISGSVSALTSATSNNILTTGTYELKWYPGNGAGGPFYCGTNTHLVAIEYNIP